MKKNMILGMILVFAVSFFFVTLLQGEGEKIVTSEGRYQLLQGTYSVFNGVDGTKSESKTVFRIDTETGETVYFKCTRFKNGAEVKGWSKVEGLVE